MVKGASESFRHDMKLGVEERFLLLPSGRVIYTGLKALTLV